MSWRYYNEYDEYDEYTDEDCDDHESPSDALILEGPLRAISKRGDIGQHWWAKQWVAAVEGFYHDDRLQRGRRYARNGSVQRLEISYGMVFAPVQGSRDAPYCVEIRLTPFKDKEWDKVLAILGTQAIYSAKLLAGEMPSDIETLFQSAGLSLFPRNLKELKFECSCPDKGNPCKHAAAIYYLLAEQVDADPFVLFHLRGRNREQIINTMRKYRSSATQEAVVSATSVPPSFDPTKTLGDDLATFWDTGLMPPLINTPLMPKSSPLLHTLGNPPGDISRDLIDLYKAVSAEAHRWLGL